MATARIRSATDGTELSLSLANDRPREDGYYLAHLRGPSLSASVEVYDLALDGIVAFFAGLAEQWRDGWPGEWSHSSPEGHLQLKATRDKLGHIFLRVVLTDRMGSGDWEAAAMLNLDAGHLPEVAAAVKNALGGP